tara:strand:+ start:278 stop:778 length:501 start_codon:yes stop_codon:yes gene_type:complete
MKFNIKEVVSDILLEDEEKKEKKKPKKSSKAGVEASTGSGRFSAGVKEAGALASENPKQLMKNLNIASATGSDDIEKIKNMLRQAFTGADAMKTVYTGLSIVTIGTKQGLRVKISTIKVRDGIKYLYHTLIGAENAGILKLDSLIQIENSSGSIIIYSGEKRTWES